MTYRRWPVAGSNAASRTVSVPLSPGVPAGGPGGELVGPLIGAGVRAGVPVGRGLAFGAGARVVVGVRVVGRVWGDVRAALAEERVALDSAIVRGAALDALGGELITGWTVVAGTAVPCSVELQATVTASSAAASAAVTARCPALLIHPPPIARLLIAPAGPLAGADASTVAEPGPHAGTARVHRAGGRFVVDVPGMCDQPGSRRGTLEVSATVGDCRRPSATVGGRSRRIATAR